MTKMKWPTKKTLLSKCLQFSFTYLVFTETPDSAMSQNVRKQTLVQRSLV